MVAVLINHALVSTKPDSSDPSVVSSSEWNAPALVSQGFQGQIMVRDAGSPTGASFIDRANATQVDAAIYSGASPGPNSCAITVVASTNIFLIVFAAVFAVTSGGANVTMSIRRDGIVVDSFAANGTGQSSLWSFMTSEVPGSHIYSVTTSASAGTFTSLGQRLGVFIMGTI